MFDKKHIIITGTRGSGKTTLINKLRDKYSFINSAPGLITWCEPGRAVYMREVGSEEFVMIGKYDQSSHQKRMAPISNGFNGYGVSLLEKLIRDDSEWATIDEIGFLESSCDPYLLKLNE